MAAVAVDRDLHLDASMDQLSTLDKQRSFGGFLRAVKQRDTKVLKTWYGCSRVPVKYGVRKTAMGEESGAGGGYIVPVEYTAALLKSLAEESFVYPRAFKWPMTARETQCPTVDSATVQAAGTSSLVGGMSFKWGSSPVPAETDPTFQQLDLTAWDLIGLTTVSNQLLMDIGPEGEQALVKLFGMAAAWSAEYAFFQGGGAGQLMPLGVLNAPSIITVARKTTSQINTQDIANMAAALLPYSWKHAIWACSPTCLAQVVQLANFFINQVEHESSNCGTLLTRPLFITDKLQALGSQGDLVLFDPSLYVVGVRQEVVVDISDQAPTVFPSYQSVFRVWLRMDGQPWVSKSITLVDGTTKVSPFVVLK